MITMVVATRNRAYTLQLVASSFFAQDMVSEIIFVDDFGEDDMEGVVRRIANDYPATKCIVHRNSKRYGQSQSRNIGASLATNDYILFCDDDEYMEDGYARICFEKLGSLNASAISGRRVYMLDNESKEDALRRFGNGLRKSRLVYYTICEYVNGAIFEGDKKTPLTNAIILTKKELLQAYPFDDYYAAGNGYREDSDFQLNLLVHGHDIYITNDCHTIHLPMSQVRTGGQRMRRLSRVYWSVMNTNYLYKKYYKEYARRMGLWAPRPVALALYSGFAVYKELVRPFLYPAAMRITRMLHKT